MATPAASAGRRARVAPASISCLLVANRGEIALRIFATARELGLRTVAVYADDDVDAPFVAAADVAFSLGGTTAAETYLDRAKILAAARAAGADAIHPGYGFGSEDPAFARAVLAAGLVFVGPSPTSIAKMADKPAAKALMAAAGVATLPSAAIDLSAPRRWRRAGDAVGYPLLVKASAGGGGRGMRRVDGASELAGAIRASSREAGASFASAEVFLERYVTAGRHVEVQVVADRHGQVFALGDRECSIQRRHQKIIEEAPAPGLGDELRAQLAAWAVDGARSIAYVGVGTFEFLLDGDRAYFLEMNTRLQVEHPVTELVTGLDLVRLQLEVAAGAELAIERDGDASAPYRRAARGHAVEARLYAEDPSAGWRPSPGRLAAFSPGPTGPIRWDSGVAAGSLVSSHFDPLLAKAIAHAPSRAEASRRLARGLDELRVHGVATNRDLLVAVLRSPAFVVGPTTTAFLDERPDLLDAGPDATTVAWHALAAAVHDAYAERRSAAALEFAPLGWRNVFSAPTERRYLGPLGPIAVRYRITPGTTPTVAADVDGRELVASVVAARAGAVELEGELGRFEATVGSGDWPATPGPVRPGSAAYVDGGPFAHPHTRLVRAVRFPEPSAGGAAGGGVAAEIPGTITAVAVAVGQLVASGERLVAMEAMKMEHAIAAPFDATVAAVHVKVGDQVEAHQVLVSLEAAAAAS